MNTTCVLISKTVISNFLMGVYIVAFILGLTFNLLTLGPIIQQVRRHNVLGVFLLNLLLSDLLYILTMPLWVNYYHNYHRWGLGSASCSVAGFIYYSNMYISIFLLCCISLDRCLAVTRPLRSKAIRSSRNAWLLCTGVVVTVMSLHVLVLIKDNLTDAHDEVNNNDRCYETYPMPEPVARFNMARVGVGFLLPLLVLGGSYSMVVGTVGQSHGLSPKAKRKVRLLSFGVIGIFTVCFAPYHILLLARSLVFYLRNLEDYCGFERATHFPFSCMLALSSLNSVVDPVLYVLVSNVKEDFRLCWGRTGRRMSRRRLRGGGGGGQACEFGRMKVETEGKGEERGQGSPATARTQTNSI
ncbi:G protein-coupled receptor 184 [Osmerus mordax]|uniref:G protein-coupled receptor 184 n=1 Tax=Osmerus mordax TaxID=8014 RepID=UPI00350FC815